MPAPVVANNKPKDIPYPVADGGDGKKPSAPSPGASFFNDVYTTAQLAQGVALCFMNPCSFMLGAIIGAAKPYRDYMHYNKVPSKTVFEANQQIVGAAFLASVSDPDFSKKGKVIAAMAFPVFGVYALGKMGGLSLLALPITAIIGSRIGQDISERYVQMTAPAFPKKK